MTEVFQKSLVSFFLIFFIVLSLPHKLSASYDSPTNDAAVLTLEDVPIFNLVTLPEMAHLSLRNFYATIYLEITDTKEGCALVKTMIRRSAKGKQGKRRSLFYDLLQKMRRGIITIEKEYNRHNDISEIYARTYLTRSLPQLNAYRNRLDLFRTGNITFKKTQSRREEEQYKQ